MPTYEYQCEECGERTEVVQSFHDAPLTVCPACAGPLRKVFAPVGIVFKGSGFYRTDSRNGSSSAAAAKDKQPGESSSASSTTSDKPADKKPGDKSDKAAASSGSSSSPSSEKVA